LAKPGDPQFVVINLPIINVPGCIRRNANTTGALHLQLSELTMGSGSPDGAVLAYQAENELLLKRYTVSDRPATSAVKKTAYRALLSKLVYMNPAGPAPASWFH